MLDLLCRFKKKRRPADFRRAPHSPQDFLPGEEGAVLGTNRETKKVSQSGQSSGRICFHHQSASSPLPPPPSSSSSSAAGCRANQQQEADLMWSAFCWAMKADTSPPFTPLWRTSSCPPPSCPPSPDTPPAVPRWRLSACCPSWPADPPITQLHHTLSWLCIRQQVCAQPGHPLFWSGSQSASLMLLLLLLLVPTRRKTGLWRLRGQEEEVQASQCCFQLLLGKPWTVNAGRNSGITSLD